MKIFKQAKGVFVPGKSSVPNVWAGFRCDFAYHGGNAEFIVAAHTFYRVYLNGIFLGAGPAPAPFGQLKADRYDLSGKLQEENRLAVEVMGYVPEDNNYATHESSVLFGEVTVDRKVVAATGDKSFRCGALTGRDFEVETLSFGRRCPMEAYTLEKGFDSWRTGRIPGEEDCETVAEAVEETWKDGGAKEVPQGCRIIRERGTAMPDLQIKRGLRMTGAYSMDYVGFDGKGRSWWENDAYLARSGGDHMKRPSYFWAGYGDRAFEGELKESVNAVGDREYEIRCGSKPGALEFSMNVPESGFIGLVFETDGKAVVDLTWNDYLDEEGQVPVRADSTNRIIHLSSEGGSISFESMEPHYIKYIKLLIQAEGPLCLKDLYVRRYRFRDDNAAEFLCSDMELNRIYEASRRTLLTNTLDFFLDSPERERGGWAGDSYWSGRAAAMLLSDTSAERSMLYDFLAADYSPMLEGSFPACCSGGRKNDPCMMYTWNLFVLLELTDYYQRTKDEEMKRDYSRRVELFMAASQSIKNELGVLENIPGAIFIDWSASNDLANTYPVSTAANGLYAMVAQCLGKMYDKDEYIEEAGQIRTVFRRAYEEVKGSRYDLFTMYPFLSDSMTVKDGRLEGNGIYSEACQYYCFWTGLLEKSRAPELWKLLKEEFGPAPARYRGTAHLKVGSCGVFFGHMMRFELLSEFGEAGLLEKEMKRLCGYMADQDPGTFWETLSGTDSRNHGFGAHYGVVLMRDFLGMGIPDRAEKVIRFAPRPGDLQWAKGSICLADGRISAFWHKTPEGIRFAMTAPKGYRIVLEIPAEYRFCRKLTVNGEEREFTGKLETENILNVLAQGGRENED